MRAKVLPLGAMGIRAWPEQNFLFEILMSMQERGEMDIQSFYTAAWNSLYQSCMEQDGFQCYILSICYSLSCTKYV